MSSPLYEQLGAKVTMTIHMAAGFYNPQTTAEMFFVVSQMVSIRPLARPSTRLTQRLPIVALWWERLLEVSGRTPR